MAGYFATLGQSADLIEGGAKPRRLENEAIARSFETEFHGLTWEEAVAGHCHSNAPRNTLRTNTGVYQVARE